jgi:hypothetical protein
VSWDQSTDNLPFRDLRLLGDGPRASQLVSNNAQGILELAFNRRDGHLAVEKLEFIANLDGSGTALRVAQPIGGNRHNRSLTVRHVSLSATNVNSNYFHKGLDTVGTWRPLLLDVLMTGPFGPTADTTVFNTVSCFDLMDAYEPSVTNVRCWSAQYGLRAWSDEVIGPEGINIRSSKFVEVDVGIYLATVGREPEGWIADNHINARRRGLALSGKKFIWVKNNLFYNQGDGTEAYQDILVSDAEKIIISDNVFHFPGNTNRTAVRVTNSTQVTIQHNMFNAQGVGISLTSDVTDTKILRNRFFDRDSITNDELNQIEIQDNGVNTEIIPYAN